MKGIYKNRDAFINAFLVWCDNKVTYNQVAQAYSGISTVTDCEIKVTQTTDKKVMFRPKGHTREKYIEVTYAKKLDKQHYQKTGEMNMIEVWSLKSSKTNSSKVKYSAKPNPLHDREREDRYDDKGY